MLTREVTDAERTKMFARYSLVARARLPLVHLLLQFLTF